MNFDFSDDQKQLRDQARKFLNEKCSPKAVRAVLDGKEPYDRELWKGLAEMGFLGVAIPEQFGGAGAGHLELCVIAEEMGRALAPVLARPAAVSQRRRSLVRQSPRTAMGAATSVQERAPVWAQVPERANTPARSGAIAQCRC